MTAPDYKDFLCEYPFEGSTWCFHVKARSHTEAEARVRAMPWATVKGETMGIIPASVPAAGLIVRATCWLRNLIPLRGAP